MRIFISWSGDTSRAIGEALSLWLPKIIQSLRPYYTPNDIEKGTRWGAEISRELEECSFGLICLTRDNLEKPWIMFEAGALSKSVAHSRVCPILFDAASSDVTGPLSQFQVTIFNRAGIQKLVSDINKQCGDRGNPQLEVTFNAFWGELESAVAKAMAPVLDMRTTPPRRDMYEMMSELLELTRTLAYRNEPEEEPPRQRGRQRVNTVPVGSGSFSAASFPSAIPTHHREFSTFLQKYTDGVITLEEFAKALDSDVDILVGALKALD